MLGDEPITRAYDRNAGYWISMIRASADPYQTQITDPALLDSIGQVTGLHILDAGCGEGYLARKLVDLGAAGVTGVDTCRAFIDAAIEAGTPRCQFVHADVAHLPLPDDNVDLVVVNRLPHGLTNAGLRYHEFARVLRPGGRLVIVGQHPCFYGAGAERSPAADDLTVDSYFDSRIVRQHLDVADQISPVPSVQKLYSLEQYFGMLTTAGFVIVGLREPRPTTDQQRADPLWRTRFQRPLFLLIEAELR
ncbi:class I SAM-dependent methyltransferase [Nocardia sp. NPDC051756]|uniref:class I SAM-dependent methyltransferase n=1 Tax=Nocardia sp. NPDC051756 TaxID=3154751 RepID=UPI003433ACED